MDLAVSYKRFARAHDDASGRARGCCITATIRAGRARSMKVFVKVFAKVFLKVKVIVEVFVKVFVQVFAIHE